MRGDEGLLFVGGRRCGGRVSARREACRHEGRLRGLEIAGLALVGDGAWTWMYPQNTM